MGLVILVVMKIRGNETWMRGAGKAVPDRPVAAGSAGDPGWPLAIFTDEAAG